MKNLKNYWMIAVMAVLGTMGFTSCSDDDGGNGGRGCLDRSYFDVVLEESYSYEEKSVKGKYRITTEAYYSYDEE